MKDQAESPMSSEDADRSGWIVCPSVLVDEGVAIGMYFGGPGPYGCLSFCASTMGDGRGGVEHKSWHVRTGLENHLGQGEASPNTPSVHVHIVTFPPACSLTSQMQCDHSIVVSLNTRVTTRFRYGTQPPLEFPLFGCFQWSCVTPRIEESDSGQH